eukprot:Ihof_evm5s230 gene=Ihof_evmTU5s230
MATPTYENFVEFHKAALVASGVPSTLWQALFAKLTCEHFDAGTYFQIAVNAEDSMRSVLVTAEEGVSKDDPSAIFLVDHAWTYEAIEAKQYLDQVPGLLERMAAIMLTPNEVEAKENETEQQTKARLTNEVLVRMWRHSQSYLIPVGENQEDWKHMWYIMDEFGSAFQHNDNPNVKFSAFYFGFTGTMYSICWPIRDMACGDYVTRDFVQDVTDPMERASVLTAWFPETQLPAGKATVDKLTGADPRLAELMQDLSLAKVEPVEVKGKVLKVCTDLPLVTEYLKHPSFTLVDSEDEADVLWLAGHFRDFSSLIQDKTLVNQFPNEAVMTNKDLLPAVIMASSKPAPSWLPVTFDLMTQLPEFIGEYRRREAEQEDNHWICKPWNLGRSLDMTVTTNLTQIIRLRESGPKVVQKYIHDPVLYNGHKFDLRFIVLVRSFSPLKLFSYDVFWTRFANEPFSLDDLGLYEKHFTVMNYRPSNLQQVPDTEFIQEFNKAYSNITTWDKVLEDIHAMFTETFKRAVETDAETTIKPHPNCRAAYGLDLMLQWTDPSHT